MTFEHADALDTASSLCDDCAQRISRSGTFGTTGTLTSDGRVSQESFSYTIKSVTSA